MDRLERQLGDQAELIRVDLMSSMGMELARRYGVRVSPTLLVFDGMGKVVYSEGGPPSVQAIVDLVAGLALG